MTETTLKFVTEANPNGRHITANHLIAGYFYDADDWRKKVEIPDEIRDELWSYFRAFVIKGSRRHRRKMIACSHWWNVRSCGILDRLWINPERNGNVEYCCGQDWDDEMNTLRIVFAR